MDGYGRREHGPVLNEESEDEDERETEKEEIQKIHISIRGISEKKRRGEKRKYRVEKRL